MSSDVLPTIVGIILVAAAAAFALLPFARGAQSDALTSEPGSPDRFVLYRQVLELEFDLQLGKLSAEDFKQQSSELMAEAESLDRKSTRLNSSHHTTSRMPSSA